MTDYRLAKIDKTAPWMNYGAPLKMGLRGCDEADWLRGKDIFGDDNAVAKQIAQKAELCQTHHEDIFKSAEEAIVPSQELCAMIKDNLQTYHHFDLADDPTLHPLDRAARALPEDLCLLAPIKNNETQKWVLKAASLAFPSHWSLEEKFGQPMSAIHQPVPDYDTHLEQAVDRFFNNMMVGPISKRRNWTLQIDDALFTPHRPATKPLEIDEVGNRLHVRVETQTLRKLPQTGWIIFTIRTAITPIRRWADDKPALRELAAILSGFSPSMRDYRGIDAYEPQLVEWMKKDNSA